MEKPKGINHNAPRAQYRFEPNLGMSDLERAAFKKGKKGKIIWLIMGFILGLIMAYSYAPFIKLW